ncbi:MAG: hypothetical protein AAGA58_02395 [Verrucomicrobiota bacterium]
MRRLDCVSYGRRWGVQQEGISSELPGEVDESLVVKERLAHQTGSPFQAAEYIVLFNIGIPYWPLSLAFKTNIRGANDQDLRRRCCHLFIQLEPIGGGGRL